VPNRIADPDNAPALAAIAARHLSPELREFFEGMLSAPALSDLDLKTLEPVFAQADSKEQEKGWAVTGSEGVRRPLRGASLRVTAGRERGHSVWQFLSAGNDMVNRGSPEATS
jgi:hypothetical protein